MGSHSGSPPPPSPECSSSAPPAGAWRRSVKRKLDQMAGDPVASAAAPLRVDVARVEIENECAALREALSSQQQVIQELCTELDEERSASASAANEAMSMILRLQREKAEIQMEARQFKRFAEEKMRHDQQELVSLEDLLSKRNQAVQSLACEVQAYKHRLLSYGIPNAEAAEIAAACAAAPDYDDGDANGNGGMFFGDPFNYPPLRCTIPDLDLNHEEVDVEKYAFGETPRTPVGHLQNLERRIYQMERTPSMTHLNAMEKGHSPLAQRHCRRFSTDSAGSFLVRETVQDCNGKRHEEFPATIDNASDGGWDEMSDRVYTVDAVHGAPVAGACDDYLNTPKDSVIRDGGKVEEADIKKLYMRLQALEADKESMRQAIISMSTDKAQLVLLKEIAQHLCKEVSPPQPEKKIIKRPSFLGTFSIISLIKWIVSFVFWKKKAHRSKYMFGIPNNKVGLLLLLDKSPRMRQWRCLTRVQG